MLKKVLFIGSLVGCSNVYAGMTDMPTNPRVFPVGKPTLSCVYEASVNHNVPFIILLGINSIERGDTGQDVGNKNGSIDTGAFQINSIHFHRLPKLNATKEDLATRGCYNAQFAAMLLSEALNLPIKRHEDLYTRASGYHSWTPRHNNVYKAKLIRYVNEWKDWFNRNPQMALQFRVGNNVNVQEQPVISPTLQQVPTNYNPWVRPNPFD